MNEKTFRIATMLLSVAAVLCGGASSAMGQMVGSRLVRADRELENRLPAAPVASGRGARTFVQPAELSAEPTHLIIESGPVSFGEVVADRDAELVDALMVRVFSDSDWELRLVPEAALAVAARAETPSMSRLQWKSPASARWLGFREGELAVISRGRRTGPSGELVSVDLRLRLSDQDPVGQYGFNLRLALETDR